MPQRPPRPCRAPGCPAKTTERHGYCAQHQDQASGWQRHHQGKSSSQRGYGSRWRKLRAMVMERDRWLCQPCQEQGIATPAHAVDHITPKAQGGDDSPGNLRAICRACHQAKTQQEASLARHGDT